MIKKIIVSTALSLCLVSSADAWLLDGENYVLMNGSAGVGTISSSAIASQVLGLEFGRNISKDWFASGIIDYGVYTIDSVDSETLNIGLKAGTIGMRVGYRPTKSTLIYGLGGLTGNFSTFGPTFGGGARWELLDNFALFGEYRQTSIISTTDNSTYISKIGTFGVELFFRY